jgi:hypothetical protein
MSHFHLTIIYFHDGTFPGVEALFSQNLMYLVDLSELCLQDALSPGRKALQHVGMFSRQYE